MKAPDVSALSRPFETCRRDPKFFRAVLSAALRHQPVSSVAIVVVRSLPMRCPPLLTRSQRAAL